MEPLRAGRWRRSPLRRSHLFRWGSCRIESRGSEPVGQLVLLMLLEERVMWPVARVQERVVKERVAQVQVQPHHFVKPVVVPIMLSRLPDNRRPTRSNSEE